MGDEGTKRPSGPLDDTQLATEPPRGDDTLLATTPATSVSSIAPPAEQRYRLGAELGRGGMGRVVEAYDTHLGRTVALKEVLPKGGNIDRRFQREVRITARLEHASIVPLYDSGVLADGRPFYVMRRVSGRPLDDLIARALTLEDRLALLPNVLAAIDAIAHAHRRGVIHRDLKPSNILVGELGETVVIDWGLAKVVSDDDEPVHDSLEPRIPSAADSLETQLGAVFGTPGFMAPEQARGDELGPSGDVYALGATLYQLLAGQPPIAGTSVTDVLEKATRHRIPPITGACPGAPAELATIIDKALAFDAAARYADAGELAEDVRRFLTGQLVGAHRYTRWQRVVRFARRHRAPLAVAALASVGIAALAWFSVHRILRERDTATMASLEAREQRAMADARANELRQRADQLLLLHARSRLESNPTETVAVLKQFEGDGARLDEANALAAAAVARGVAHGLPTLPDLTVRLEMTRDGKRLLQHNRHGQLNVLDLDNKRVIASYTAPVGSMVMWIAGGRLIYIQPSKAPPLLYDPSTGKTDAIGTAVITESTKTPQGERMALIDDNGRLTLFELATRQLRDVPTGKLLDRVVIARDGSWIAVVEDLGNRRTRLVVVDPTGAILAQRETSVVVLAASRDGKLAVATGEGVIEVRPADPKPTFTNVRLDAVEGRLVHELIYRDDRLHIFSHRYLMTWTGTQLVRHQGFSGGAMIGLEAHDNALVLTASDGTIHVLGDGLAHTLPVTSKPPGIVRIAAAPGVARLAATARDAILVWDLSQIVPPIVDGDVSAVFTSETRLVQPAGMNLEWRWRDLADNTEGRMPLATEPGLPRELDVATDGRVMQLIARSDTTSSAVIAYPDGKRQVVVDGIRAGLARLVEDDGLIYSPGGGRVLGKRGDDPSSELVKVDGNVQSIAPLGKLGYAALGDRGELVRASFGGPDPNGRDAITRRRVDGIGDGAFVARGPSGEVLLANGSRLLRWSTDLHEVASFTSPIAHLVSSASGTCVTLDTNEMFFVVATWDRTPKRLAPGDHVRVAASGERIVSINAANQLEIIELPSLATWTMPKLFTALPRFSLSPSGRVALQNLGMRAALVRFPEPGSDFGAWLDAQTNATHVDNHLRWPWQLQR